MKAFLALLVVMSCLLPAGCLESRMPDGVVATVNGEPIHLRSLLALQDCRSSGPALQRQTPETMRQEYGEALGTLIIMTLASQELERRNLQVSEAAVDAAVAVVELDYAEHGGLAKYLSEQSMDAGQWRAFVRSGLVMEKLEREVLLPTISPDLPAIRQYYENHADAFRLPEMLDVCLVAAPDKASLQKYCAAFPQKRAAGLPELYVDCKEMAASDLPAPWHAEAARLEPGKCSSLREQDGQWRGIALVRRNKPHPLGLAAAYPLVERKLQEAGRQKAFETWLATSLAASRIQVASQLVKPLLAAPANLAQDESGHGNDLEDDVSADDLPGNAGRGGQRDGERK